MSKEELIFSLLKDKDNLPSHLSHLRALLNENDAVPVSVGLDKELSWLAKSPLFHDLPKPTSEDKGYRDFYFIVEAMRKTHLLAHRIDIPGQGQIKGHGFNWHGSFEDVMVPEMTASFQQFVNKITAITGTEKSALTDTFSHHLLSILKQVSDDLTHVLLNVDLDTIDKQLQSPLALLTPTLRTDDSAVHHAIAVALYKDICLIADRGRNKQNGIKIYKLQGTLEEQSKRKKIVASYSVGSARTPLQYALLRNSECDNYFKEVLQLQEIGYFPLTMKYGMSCAWSSCAQMVVLCALYLRFFEFVLKNINDNAQVNETFAHTLAQKLAKCVFSAWSNEDYRLFLKEYLSYYQQPEMQQYGPDNLLLNVAYLKASHRPKRQHVLDALKDQGIISEQQQANAKQHMVKMGEELLKIDFAVKDSQEGATFEEPAAMMTELYLKTNKKMVEAVYQEMKEFIIKRDWLAAMELLRAKLKEAETIKWGVEYPVSSLTSASSAPEFKQLIFSLNKIMKDKSTPLSMSTSDTADKSKLTLAI